MADLRPDPLRLRDFDVDGAVRETFEQCRQETRAGFISLAAGAGAVIALGARPAAAAAAAGRPPSPHDTAILNFALALEYLQAAFYTEAERIGALHGALAHRPTSSACTSAIT